MHVELKEITLKGCDYENMFNYRNIPHYNEINVYD